MAEEHGGLSRRRILQGAVWTAPAIIIATAAPARAASGDSGALIYIGLGAFVATNFWNASASEVVIATTVSANVQNQPTVAGEQSPPVLEFTITYVAPVGNPANPVWGSGSNYEGIADTANWEVAQDLTIVDGIATVALRYIGDPLLTYQTKQPTVWIKTETGAVGNRVDSSFVAIHDGATSSDAESTMTTAGLLEFVRDSRNTTTDWVYTPPPPPP